MTPEQLRKILGEVEAGNLSADDALRRVKHLPFDDLGFARVDHHRELRVGFPETGLVGRIGVGAPGRVGIHLLCGRLKLPDGQKDPSNRTELHAAASLRKWRSGHRYAVPDTGRKTRSCSRKA